MPGYLTNDVLGYLLVFARIGGMLMLMPGLGDDNVPVRVRLTFALLVSAVVYPVVFLQLPSMPTSLEGLAGLLGREVVLGLMLGAAVRILMQALHVAGTIIANQSGLAAAMMFDPGAGGQGTIFTRYLGLMGLVVIFSADIHHIMIEGLVRSYALFEARGGLMVEDFAKGTTQAVAASFALGVQLSAPFLVMGVVFNVGLGLISRLVPTLQVFFVAMPLGILLSFALLLAVIGMTLTVFADRFAAALRALLGG
jgi:flagellar biosynthesis protein FliR